MVLTKLRQNTIYHHDRPSMGQTVLVFRSTESVRQSCLWLCYPTQCSLPKQLLDSAPGTGFISLRIDIPLGFRLPYSKAGNVHSYWMTWYLTSWNLKGFLQGYPKTSIHSWSYQSLQSWTFCLLETPSCSSCSRAPCIFQPYGGQKSEMPGAVIILSFETALLSGTLKW